MVKYISMNKFVSIFITFLSILSACSEEENTRGICFRERESVPVSELMAEFLNKTRDLR